MKRIFDLSLGVVMLALLAAPMILIAIAIRLTSKGSALYWSDRVAMRSEKVVMAGSKDKQTFKMPKFRTMQKSTPTVATHLLEDPGAYLSPIGGFLRRSSLDELPQLFSVLKGDMSFVGPRPALYNQDDLIELRSEKK